MLKFIEFLKSRPKDKTIRIGRILFWMIISILLWIYFNDYTFFGEVLKDNEIYAKFSLFLLWIVPMIMWIDFCFAKRKYVRIMQIIFWIILIFVWNNIDVKKEDTKVCNTNEFECKKNEVPNTSDLKSLQEKTSTSKPLNIWFIIALLGILPIIAWISGKCITQKCYKYWEIITKIRV